MADDVRGLMREVDALVEERDWDLALEKLVKILEKDSQNADACQRLAHVFAVRGRIKSVVQAYFKLMEILEERGDLEGALEVAGWIQRLQPEADRARMRIIQIFRKKGDLAEVVRRSRDLARLYIELGQGDQSIALLQGAQEADPQNLDIGLELAEMYVSYGHIEEGANQYRRIADAFQEAGNVDKAAEAYRRMKVIVPDDPGVLFTLGRLYVGLGRFNEAEQEFRSILRHNLNHEEALLALGDVCQRKGQFRDAILAFNKILSINPQENSAREKLGELYHAQGVVAEAVKHYLSAAHAYQQLEENARAVKLYRRVLALDPTNPTSCRELTNLGAPLTPDLGGFVMPTAPAPEPARGRRGAAAAAAPSAGPAAEEEEAAPAARKRKKGLEGAEAPEEGTPGVRKGLVRREEAAAGGRGSKLSAKPGLGGPAVGGDKPVLGRGGASPRPGLMKPGLAGGPGGGLEKPLLGAKRTLRREEPAPVVHEEPVYEEEPVEAFQEEPAPVAAVPEPAAQPEPLEYLEPVESGPEFAVLEEEPVEPGPLASALPTAEEHLEEAEPYAAPYEEGVALHPGSQAPVEEELEYLEPVVEAPPPPRGPKVAAAPRVQAEPGVLQVPAPVLFLTREGLLEAIREQIVEPPDPEVLPWVPLVVVDEGKVKQTRELKAQQVAATEVVEEKKTGPIASAFGTGGGGLSFAGGSLLQGAKGGPRGTRRVSPRGEGAEAGPPTPPVSPLGRPTAAGSLAERIARMRAEKEALEREQTASAEATPPPAAPPKARPTPAETPAKGKKLPQTSPFKLGSRAQKAATPAPEELKTPEPEPVAEEPAPMPVTAPPAPGPAEEEMLAGPPSAEEEMLAGPASAEEEMLAGPASAEEEMLAGPASAEEEMLAGPASAEEEMLAGPAPAEEEMLAGPASAEEEMLAGPAPAEEEMLAGPAPAEEERLAGPAPAEEERLAGPASAEEERLAGPAPAEEEVPAAPAPAAEEVPAAPAPAEEETPPALAPVEEILPAPEPVAEAVPEPVPSAEEEAEAPRATPVPAEPASPKAGRSGRGGRATREAAPAAEEPVAAAPEEEASQPEEAEAPAPVEEAEPEAPTPTPEAPVPEAAEVAAPKAVEAPPLPEPPPVQTLSSLKVESEFSEPQVQEARRMREKLGGADVTTAIGAYRRAVEESPENLVLRTDLADIHLRYGMLDDAVVQYRQILLRKPESVALRHRLADAHLWNAEYDEAASTLLDLAELHIEKGQEADALDILQTILGLDPHHFGARRRLVDRFTALDQKNLAAHHLRQLAETALARGNVREAIGAFQQLMTLSDDPTFEERLAQVYETQGSVPEALAHYRALAQRYRAGGQWDEATAATEKLVTLDPDNLDDRRALIDLHAQQGRQDLVLAGQFELAGRQQLQGALPEAIALFEQVLEADPACFPARRHLVDCYLASGNLEGALAQAQPLTERYLEGRETGPAIDLYRRLTEADPKSVELRERLLKFYEMAERREDVLEQLLYLVELHEGAERYREAVQVLQRALEVAPSRDDLHYRLGCLYDQKLGSAPGALSEFRRVHELNPGHPEAMDRYARMLLEQRKAREAAEVLLKLFEANSEQGGISRELITREYKERIEADPSEWSTRFVYGELCFYLSRIEDAVEQFQKTRTDREHELRSYNMLGLAFARNPRFGLDMAVRQFRRGLETKGHAEQDYLDLRYNLATLLYQNGRLQEALTELKDILAVDVAFRDVDERVKLIQEEIAAGGSGKVSRVPPRRGT